MSQRLIVYPSSSTKRQLPVLNRVLSCRHLSGGPFHHSFRCLPRHCSAALISGRHPVPQQNFSVDTSSVFCLLSHRNRRLFFQRLPQLFHITIPREPALDKASNVNLNCQPLLVHPRKGYPDPGNTKH